MVILAGSHLANPVSSLYLYSSSDRGTQTWSYSKAVAECRNWAKGEPDLYLDGGVGGWSELRGALEHIHYLT